MAIITDFKFKGMDIKSYLNFNNYTVQKQYFQTDKDSPKQKVYSITVELFFNTEKNDYFLESRPFNFVADTLDGLTTETIYQKINEQYKGERV